MTARKPILYALNFFPYPADSGGKRVSLTTLKELCTLGSVDMICFDHGIENGHVEQLRSICKGLSSITLVPYSRKPRWWLPIYNLIGKSYFFHRDASVPYREALYKLLEETDYQVLFADTVRTSANIGPVVKQLKPKLRVVGQLANINSLMVRRFMNRRPWLWPLLWMEYLLSRRQEKQWWLQLDRTVFISPADRSIAEQMTGNRTSFEDAFPCPADMDVPVCSPHQSSAVILHVGTGSWLPNVDAVKIFVRHVFPLIRREMPEAVFRAVGGGMPDSIKRLGEMSQVEMPGYVTDLEPEYQHAAVFVVPLRFGSGIKIKILDAMARGIPVVASPVAMEGIPFGEDDGVLTAELPHAFADMVVALLRDEARRGRMGQQARDAIERVSGSRRLADIVGIAEHTESEGRS